MNHLRYYLARWKISKNDNGRYFLDINWEEIFDKAMTLLDTIINKGLLIVIITLATCFIIKMGNKLINRFVDNQVKSKRAFSMDEKKALTVGAISINASGVTIRVIGKTKPLLQWELERELRKEIKIALDENGIKIPYPKTQIINEKVNIQ